MVTSMSAPFQQQHKKTETEWNRGKYQRIQEIKWEHIFCAWF